MNPHLHIRHYVVGSAYSHRACGPGCTPPSHAKLQCRRSFPRSSSCDHVRRRAQMVVRHGDDGITDRASTENAIAKCFITSIVLADSLYIRHRQCRKVTLPACRVENKILNLHTGAAPQHPRRKHRNEEKTIWDMGRATIGQFRRPTKPRWLWWWTMSAPSTI